MSFLEQNQAALANTLKIRESVDSNPTMAMGDMRFALQAVLVNLPVDQQNEITAQILETLNK
jgi:hypothetical protein